MPLISDSVVFSAPKWYNMLGLVKSWFLICTLNSLVDRFKMALDCFFAVWFLVGNVWIFGGHSSPSEAPKLYRYIRKSYIFLFHFYWLSPWFYISYCWWGSFQVMFSVPDVQRYWVCHAIHTMCNNMFLLALHNISPRFSRGSFSNQRSHPRIHKCSTNLQVQVDKNWG